MSEAGAGWAAMLRLALAMGLAPEAFWRLSLREWRMLTEPASASSTGWALGRAELERMAEAWPDD
ncbi:MAG: phage tail assembly chaperone [Brevundimonas sp.]|uniref:phage tail assembly chaperone n=1 Tax=Brevundimonas sp. TaxID=1871086 RepID=UPI004034D5E9